MVRDLIEGIKETEAKAAALIEEAKKRKAEIVAKARDDARKLIEEAEKQGTETVKQALVRAQQDAKLKTEEIAEQERAARETIKQASSKNISKAVDLIIERVLR
jgi:vacuolar-type H+-ATPase subunit H